MLRVGDRVAASYPETPREHIQGIVAAEYTPWAVPASAATYRSWWNAAPGTGSTGRPSTGHQANDRLQSLSQAKVNCRDAVHRPFTPAE